MKRRENEMCEWGNNINVWVKIPADMSYTGKERYKFVGIDSCIAPIVKALQERGIDMRGSCCGHGKFPGNIELLDGRRIMIFSPEQLEKYFPSELETTQQLVQDVCGK